MRRSLEEVDPAALDSGASRPYSAYRGPYHDPVEVGEFSQGNDATRWILARYLISRALAVQVNATLIVLAVIILAFAGFAFYSGSNVLAVLITLVAGAVLLVRSAIGALLRRTTMAMITPGAEHRLRRLVADTRTDVGRELRRIGLPGRPWSLPLLVIRVLGRRRAETFRRLRDFDIDRVVPAARLDELHLVIAAAASRSA